MNRATASDRPRSSRRRSRNDSLDPTSPAPPSPAPSPPLEPPPLTSAYQALVPPQPSLTDIPEPPDTPPPLAQAYPTLPPPSAPIYPQLPLPERDTAASARSTPEASYHSPVTYPHSSLATAYPQYEDHTYSSSQDSRASSSFGRPAGDDPRWTYPQQQSYPASDSDRYSPASPATHVHYTAPASPVDAYSVGTHRPSGSGGYPMSHQQESVSYYGQFQPRQTTSGTSLATTSAQNALAQQSQSTNRHSIAHISNPVVRQHSPTTSTNSASPVVSHPSTPGYGYVPSSMGSYAESPPGSVSPVAQTSAQLPSGMVAAPTYGSYESNSLASAGYALPPPQTQSQPQTTAYGRILPSLSPANARDSQTQPPQVPSTLSTHFTYGQATSYGGVRRSSPPPVLAPIQDSRVLRRDAGAATSQTQGGMRYASPPQPPMQSLARVSRSSGGHAFPYPPPPTAHSPTYASSSYGSASSVSAGANANGSGYYYQQQQQQQVAHGHRDPSPESVGATAEQYLELHQPQPQRVAHTNSAHHHHAHQHHDAQQQQQHAQYMQTGVGLGGGGQAHAHAGYHPVWRAEEDYHRGRGGLVQ
ncbi:hypothetical protein BC628DRAFT_366646 [Trametes gibbosa]|nr:hypothetical protein BC628DRAFT_366646 [Trametes gibbosa]